MLPRITLQVLVLVGVVVTTSWLHAKGSSPAGEVPSSTDDTATTVITGEPELERLEGLTIMKIICERREIFDTSDPPTSKWPYRWANALHIVSTEDFIRSMLLFSEGDPYSAHQADESARILRSLGIMNPVMITAREVEGGVEVTVDTHDQWTLQVGAKFGLFGSRSDYAFSIDEENLLGRGWEINLKYRSNNERDTWTYGLYDPNILGTRWRAGIKHVNATDGHENQLRADYPFYSLATPRAWGVEWQDREWVEHLYSESETVVSGTTLTDSAQLWGGLLLRSTATITRRLVAGYDYRRKRSEGWTWEEDGSPYPEPAPMEVSGIRVGYQQIVDEFLVLRGYRAWRAQEDVALGPNWNVGLTVSLPALGGDEVRYLFDGRVEATRRRGSWMLLGEAWTMGRVDTNRLRNTIVGGQVAATQLGDRGWQARLIVEGTHELDRDRQLTLGADIGLRGWDPDFFDGTGRALLNLQWRTKLVDDVLQLFSLGMVVFADAGYTWNPRVGPGMDRVHADVGVGLVADMTHIGLVKLLRLEVALPDDYSGYTFTITTSTLF